MTNLEKPLDFPQRALSAAHGLPSAAAIRTAVLLAILLAYGLGFAALYPLVQASAARSAAEGNDPMLFVGS
jgi:hypothetical protein